MFLKNSRIIVLFFIISCGNEPNKTALTKKYSKNDSFDDYCRNIHLKALHVLKEDYIDSTFEFYRIIIIPTFEPVCMLKISKKSANSLEYNLELKKISGSGGYEKTWKNITEQSSKITTYSTFEKRVFEYKFKQTNFWELDNEKFCDISDGDIYIIECQTNDKYNLVVRRSFEICQDTDTNRIVDFLLTTKNMTNDKVYINQELLDLEK